MIKHSNIVYMPKISPLGGIETYVYEIVKKYKDLDIAVVSKDCDSTQAKRIRKLCPLYIHTDQKIECDVAIINYDTSIIKYINKEAKIYETIHGDYSNREIYDFKPPTDPRITGYIAITKYLQDKVKELLNVDNVIMSYNPLTIEKDKPFLTFVSATRLHKHKGVSRIKEFLKALDRQKIDYVWYILTNDTDVIKHPNVIMIPNRLDIDKWLRMADYVILLSDTEACSYTLNEALYRNIPIISTPLPYLEEIGVKDGVNSYIINFDCSNVDEVAEKINNIPKFTFKQLKDDYDKIFTKSNSKYKEVLDMKYKVEAILDFYDMDEREDKYKELPELNKDGSKPKKSQHIWVVDKERCDYLLEHNAIKILEEIKPTKIEMVKDVKGRDEKTGKLITGDTTFIIEKEPETKSKKTTKKRGK